MIRDAVRTDDGRFVVVDGRRWRTADPALPGDVRKRLLHHLGVARPGVRTAGRSGDEAAVAAARARVRLGQDRAGGAVPRLRKDLPAPHRSQARGGPLQGGRPLTRQPAAT